MCGIYGSTSAVSSKAIEEVQALLHHRGPDSYGVQEFKESRYCLTLLHTRLAIQDLSPLGHQPMQSQDGDWWVTFNGEIYNHHELRKSLDVKFKGTSDTETLVEHISAFGVKQTIEKLNGIFGFFAYDSRNHQGYLVRDQFGIKPVYYIHDNNELTFSSEIKPLLSGMTSNRSINTDALDSFLCLRYTPSEQTLLAGVNRLPPGHCLKVDLNTGAVEQQCYIVPVQQKFKGSLEDAVAGYHHHLKLAVKRQLISDVPVGVLLSGGIDSAVIAALAKEQLDELTGYTVGFGGQHAECEIDDARETADVLGMQHKYVTVTPDDLLDSLSSIVHQVEEPLGTTSIMPMWYLTEKAKQDVTVVLTGQGNDEPWGGYRRYQIELLLGKMPFLKSGLFGYASGFSENFKNEAIRRGLRCLGIEDTPSRFLQAYALFSNEERRLINPKNDNSGFASIAAINKWLDFLGENQLADAERMMRLDARMNLSDDLLLYGDKISMAYALEARVPMLDPELVNFIESLPLNYRTSLKSTKIAHRAMAKSYLPAKIINRKKKGFQVPFSDWSKNRWRDFIEENLLSKNRKIYSFLSHDGVKTLWDRHLKASPDMSKQIFALLALSLWAEFYL